MSEALLWTFDERREIWKLLNRLDKRDRISFLKAMCQKVSKPGMQTFVEQQSGETNDIYWDLMRLCCEWDITLTEIGEYLVRVVRSRGL